MPLRQRCHAHIEPRPRQRGRIGRGTAGKQSLIGRAGLRMLAGLEQGGGMVEGNAGITRLCAAGIGQHGLRLRHFSKRHQGQAEIVCGSGCGVMAQGRAEHGGSRAQAARGEQERAKRGTRLPVAPVTGQSLAQNGFSLGPVVAGQQHAHQFMRSDAIMRGAGRHMAHLCQRYLTRPRRHQKRACATRAGTR